MPVLKWISQLGGGIDDRRHPLGIEDGLAEFLQMLPLSQPAAALQQICEALEQARDLKLAAPALRRALRSLDDTAQPCIDELWHTLFRDARGEQVSDVSYTALSRYSRRTAALFQACLADAAPGGEKEALEGIALLALRAMRALMCAKKLERMAYRMPEPALWEAARALQQRASQLGVLRAVVEPYPARAPARISVAQEFLAGLLLETAPLGSLLPTQVECLDVLLHRNAAALLEGDKGDGATPFYFDQAKPQLPQRWLPGLPKRESMRFFGPGALVERVAALRAEAEKASDVPDWAVPSGCAMESYRALLDSLHQHWSDKPPQRRDRRQAEGGEVLIVHGLSQTRRMVAASERARSETQLALTSGDKMRNERYFDRIRFGTVDADKTATGKLLHTQLLAPKQVLDKFETAGDRQLMLRSQVADASDSGLGIALDKRAPWARPGVLVGYRSADSLDWSVAIVRRLGRSQNSQTLGLERLVGSSVTAHAMAMRDPKPQSVERAGLGDAGVSEAILVEGPALMLVAPPGFDAAGQWLLLWVRKEKRLARVKALRETGRDFGIFALQPGP